VLLLFAPQGHSLIEQLGKMKKNDEVKMAKFGHVVANDPNHPLMKKYRLKKVPCVLIGSKGDPEDLNKSLALPLLLAFACASACLCVLRHCASTNDRAPTATATGRGRGRGREGEGEARGTCEAG